MIDLRAVRRYSSALFALAKERGELEQLESDFQEVRRLVDTHKEISHLVANSTISLAEKEDFIDKIMPPRLSKLLIHFLKVLIKKKRFQNLADLQEEYHRLFEQDKGIQEVEVLTAVELPPAYELRLRQVLANKLNAEIRLAPKVDPRLIGGLILRFAGKEINASYRSRLEELRQSLVV